MNESVEKYISLTKKMLTKRLSETLSIKEEDRILDQLDELWNNFSYKEIQYIESNINSLDIFKEYKLNELSKYKELNHEQKNSNSLEKISRHSTHDIAKKLLFHPRTNKYTNIIFQFPNIECLSDTPYKQTRSMQSQTTFLPKDSISPGVSLQIKLTEVSGFQFFLLLELKPHQANLNWKLNLSIQAFSGTKKIPCLFNHVDYFVEPNTYHKLVRTKIDKALGSCLIVFTEDPGQILIKLEGDTHSANNKIPVISIQYSLLLLDSQGDIIIQEESGA